MSRKLSRRRFSALGARALSALLAAPAVVQSGVLAVPGRPAAAERVGTGHIGLGGMGSGHLGSYLGESLFHAVALCDVDAAQLKRAALRVGAGCATHADYRELLDRKDVQAVVIAVPDHWHALCAVHACQAGKDVYCEKPLSLTIAQGIAMVQAARASGRVFQTGSQQRSSEEFRRASELVRSGRLGKLTEVLVEVWGSSRRCYLPAEPVPSGLDWDRWIGPAPWRPYHSGLHPGTWRAYRDFSGGTLTDWGAHHLDIAQWGLGTDGSGPVEVLPPGPDRRDRITYRYPSGVLVHCGKVGVNGVQFVGARGKITVNRGFFRAEPEEIAREPLAASEVSLPRSEGHHADWQRAVLTRARPIADVEIGHRSATVCHIGNIALWLGRPLGWDPEKQEFMGDPEANRWLDRPMRAPYRL
jgi:predicted dehydrogenase